MPYPESVVGTPVSSLNAILLLANVAPVHFNTWLVAILITATSASSEILWLVKSKAASATLPGSYTPLVELYINACPFVACVLDTSAKSSVVDTIVGRPVSEAYCPSNNEGLLLKSV